MFIDVTPVVAAVVGTETTVPGLALVLIDMIILQGYTGYAFNKIVTTCL